MSYLSVQETINGVNALIADENCNVSKDLLNSVAHYLKNHKKACKRIYEKGVEEGRRKEIEMRSWDNAVFSGGY